MTTDTAIKLARNAEAKFDLLVTTEEISSDGVSGLEAPRRSFL